MAVLDNACVSTDCAATRFSSVQAAALCWSIHAESISDGSGLQQRQAAQSRMNQTRSQAAEQHSAK